MKSGIQIKITGKVQGVFYRKYAVAKAIELGIVGYVKNQVDGSVFIIAYAEDNLLSLFVDWCYSGSVNAVVDDVAVTVLNIENSFVDFVQQ